MLSIEGADVIEGKIGLLRIFHRLGVRMVGLVHSLRNELVDGVADRRTKGGLSELGVVATTAGFQVTPSSEVHTADWLAPDH